jgi:hypothetical protein
LIILTPPTCTISGPTNICVGQVAHLCGTSNMTGYVWMFANEVISTAQCIDVSAPGDYTLVVTDSHGCTSTCDQVLTLNTPPPCSITGTNMICSGLTAHLCATNGFTSYSWSGPSNYTAHTQCVDVGNNGTYTVTVTDSNGCTSTCSQFLMVTPKPDCTISGSTNVICGGNSAVLCAPSGALAYSWSGPNMYMAFSQCITVNVAGVYSVTVVGPNSTMPDGSVCEGCLASCQFNINGCNTNSCPVCTNTGPTCIIAGLMPVCVASTNTYSVTGSTTNSTFSWSIAGNGEILGTTSGSNVTVLAGAPGSYMLGVSVTCSNLTGSCAKLVVVQECTPQVGAAVCVTRPPSFWKNLASSTDTNCATLLKAIDANGGKLDLGFVCLPTKDVNHDHKTNDVDTLRQAMGIMWNSLSGKNLTAVRKQFAYQMVAAIANDALFGTDPDMCMGGSASNLFSRARAAAACNDTNAIKSVTAELTTFNLSGNAAPLPNGLQDCTSSANTKAAKKLKVGISSSFYTKTNYCGVGFACQAP